MKVFYRTYLPTISGPVEVKLAQCFNPRNNENDATHTLLTYFYNGGFVTWCLVALTKEIDNISHYNFDELLQNLLVNVRNVGRVDDIERGF